MIYSALFVLFLACHSFALTSELSNAISSVEKPIFVKCSVPTNVSSHLNSAIEMIKNALGDNQCGYESYATLPSDCEDILRRGYTSSGIYEVLPRSRVVQKSIKVYCDMTTDGGGWTVLQRRGNFGEPEDYFFKNWQSYKKGFGHPDYAFWLGNDNIFALSNQKLYSVRFDLKDFEGNELHALYDTFWIDDESQKYTLHIDGYSGDAGDSMTDPEIGYTHDGMEFSTIDKNSYLDVEGKSCAARCKGAWWYDKCHRANLNGLYHKGVHKSFADGVNWYSWKGYYESLERTEIKIRSKDFGKQ